MEIVFNEFKEIIGYARIGHIKNAIEISEEELPSDFFDNYEPSKYIYDEHEGIIINQNYNIDKELVDSIPSITNIEEAKREIEVLKNAKENLNKRINKLESKIDILVSEEL